MDELEDTRVFLTASDAYPALEHAFLEARSEISAGFRVFDPATKVRSPEARKVGETWYDLIAHTLSRGVRFRLILSDFDPIVRPAAHRMTWRAVRRLINAGEASGRPELLQVIPAMQTARIGKGSAALLWPKLMREIRHETKRLNKLDRNSAQCDMKLMPGLAPYVSGEHPHYKPDLGTMPRLVPTTHHQKIAVFDTELLYIGGLDLDERRFDSPAHDRPPEDTWRDCQVMTRGTIAGEAKQHLDEILAVTAGETKPFQSKHLLRTLSAPNSHRTFTLSPKPLVSEIEDAHLRYIHSAKDLIYLETQYFRSTPIANALSEAAQSNPDLKFVLVLPGAPEDVAFGNSTKSDARYGEYLQAKCLDTVASAFGDRFFATAPAQQRHSDSSGRDTLSAAPLIYLHAKVSIFDEEAAIVSSANLNGRSLRWDTETGITIRDPKQVADLTQQCLRHWIPDDVEIDLQTMLQTIRGLARANAERAPDKRNGFLLPYKIKPARRFGRNLPGVPEEMT